MRPLVQSMLFCLTFLGQCKHSAESSTDILLDSNRESLIKPEDWQSCSFRPDQLERLVEAGLQPPKPSPSDSGSNLSETLLPTCSDSFTTYILQIMNDATVTSGCTSYQIGTGTRAGFTNKKDEISFTIQPKGELPANQQTIDVTPISPTTCLFKPG